MAARGEGNERPKPRWSSDGDISGRNATNNPMGMQRNRDEDEDQETQCSNEKDGTVVKRRNRPMIEAAVMQRRSHKNKAVVL